MKRSLSHVFSRLIIGGLLSLIGSLGFAGCKSRATNTTNKRDNTEHADSTDHIVSRPVPGGTGMLMYGTPTTTFELKEIVPPDGSEE